MTGDGFGASRDDETVTFRVCGRTPMACGSSVVAGFYADRQGEMWIAVSFQAEASPVLVYLHSQGPKCGSVHEGWGAVRAAFGFEEASFQVSGEIAGWSSREVERLRGYLEWPQFVLTPGGLLRRRQRLPVLTAKDVAEIEAMIAAKGWQALQVMRSGPRDSKRFATAWWIGRRR